MDGAISMRQYIGDFFKLLYFIVTVRKVLTTGPRKSVAFYCTIRLYQLLQRKFLA